MQEEINQLTKQNTWDLVDLPNNRKALKGRWVYKIKTDQNNNIIKYKARWVVKGYNQIYGLDYLDTFANTTRIEAIRLLLFLAADKNLEIKQLDFKNAFLHAEIEEEIYVEQPIGFYKNKTKVCKLNKTLYGLKQSPRAWYLYLASILEKLNYYPIFIEQGIFYNKKDNIYIIVYVDDLLIIGENLKLINYLKIELSKYLDLTDLGDVKYFLGLEIIRNREKRSIILKQSKYIDNILTKFSKKNLNPISTPMEPGLKLNKNLEKAEEKEIKLYQQYIGSLIFLTTRTRPDLAFSVYNCARFMSNPNKSHFNAVNRIFKYLNFTPNIGLYYKQSESKPYILGYTDADWGGDLVSRKSTTGYLFTFNKTPISWSSKLQKSTALSSCEAEYMALKEAIKEHIYLINLLKQLNIYNSEKYYLFCDNQPAIDLANNPEYHSKTKHIDIQYHFVREKILEKVIDLNYISTKEQLADIFTKSVNINIFKYIFENLSLKE
jgi:hypothetical protein